VEQTVIEELPNYLRASNKTLLHFTLNKYISINIKTDWETSQREMEGGKKGERDKD
jgi:hypothetical protein